jgi:hypothetical protein
MEFCVKTIFTTKQEGYSVVCQVVVNNQKQFINISMGLPRSVNDSRMFKSFVTYYFVQFQRLLNADKGQEGFAKLFCQEIKGIPYYLD